MTIGETLALGPGSIVTLNRLAGEPVDLLVNGKPIARGEVVVIDEEFGLRVDRGARAPAEARGAAGAASPGRAPPASFRGAIVAASPVRVAAASGARPTRTTSPGIAAMVAYNLLLSIFPLALVALFVAGRCSPPERRGVGGARPRAAVPRRGREHADRRAPARPGVLDHRSASSPSSPRLVLRLVLGRARHGVLPDLPPPCRSWVRQKLFGLGMLVVVLLFIVASVAVPALQALLVTGAEDLPFGLAEVRGLVYGCRSPLGLVLLFGALCLTYRLVPEGAIPWRCVWPGALGATVAMGSSTTRFPLYLSNVSTLRIGTSFVFVLIALVWFYVLALILLAGAVVNELRRASNTAESAGRPWTPATAVAPAVRAGLPRGRPIR